MKAIFTTKLGSGYDDLVEERYHFPSTYLAQVTKALNDLIVYYEPRRKLDAALGGRQAYFAIARVVNIEPDARRTGHYYAKLIDFLDFDQKVPFKTATGYFESKLQRADGETNKGAFRRSVRNISDEEFESIVAMGFSLAAPADSGAAPDLWIELDDPPANFKHAVVEISGTRLFRDRAFARHIQTAYDRTCAITGMQIINGGGRPEAQAAHIQPVVREVPDSVRNGVALSSTLHWMFDRGLVSVDTDYRILFARSGVPPPIRQLVNPTGRLMLPDDQRLWPHRTT